MHYNSLWYPQRIYAIRIVRTRPGCRMATKFLWDVYLAGGITGRKQKAIMQERFRARMNCVRFGLSYYDPAQREVLGVKKKVDTRPSHNSISKYVKRDNWAVDRCRSLVNLTGDIPTIGGGWEMARMLFINKRPTIAVGRKPSFTSVILKTFSSQKQAFKYLKKELK